MEINTLKLVNLKILVQNKQKKNNQIFDQKCLILVFLGCNFENLLPHLKSKTSNVSACKVSCNLKNYFNTWNHHPWISHITIFCAKIKKNVLFRRVLGCNFKKLLSHLKSTPSNLTKINFSQNSDFGIRASFPKGPGSAFLKLQVDFLQYSPL